MSGAFDAIKSSGAVKVEPLPLRGERVAAAPYPVEHLGERMARAVRAIVRRVQLPDSIAAHSVLAAVAVAVQGHVIIELPTKQRRPPSLFLGTVADSGDRKTTADQIAMQPIVDYEMDLGAGSQRDKSIFASMFAVWKGAKDQIAKEHKAAGAEKIADEIDALGPAPVEPLLPVIVLPPGSTQGVIWALEKGRPSVGLFVNEGGTWLGSWGMQDENRTATISAYSELWDGQPIKTLTKGEGYRFLPNRAFSFHVMFQPVYAEQMFADEEMRGQGFINRILATQPVSLAGSRLKDVNEAEPEWVGENIGEYYERLSRIIRSPLPANADPMLGLTDRRSISFSAEAEQLFWTFYNHVETQQAEGAPLASIKGFAGKAVEQAARLAANVHVFEHGLGDRAISAVSMQHAIRLMEYYIAEALRLANATPEDPRLIRAEILSNWLRDGWQRPEIGLRFIQQKAPREIRSLKADEIRELCEVLARHDHLTVIPTGAKIDDSQCRDAWRVHVLR